MPLALTLCDLTDVESGLDTIEDEVNNLDSPIDSILEEVVEIETHLHSAGSWFELAGTPDGENHVAVRIGNSDGAGAFIIDAGNDDWGSWVQVLGTEDTPARTGNTFFDPHSIVISSTERTATYFVQLARGDSGAAGLSAGTYTEFVYSASTNKYSGIISMQTGRAPVGAKLWARCMCPGQDTGTMNFYLGIHEYEE